MYFKKYPLFILFFALTFYACNPARKLPEGQYLLTKNVIVADTGLIEKDRLASLIKQKPNRKILGVFRFHLGVYNLGNHGKPTKFKNWLKSIGEEPTILDTALVEKSRNQINLLVHKQGFFNSTVTDTVLYKHKTAKVNYAINYGRPYLIRNVVYDTKDPVLKNLLFLFDSHGILNKGSRYDEDLIEKERDKIASDIKDRGYYFFSKNYITIQVDSSLGTHETDIFFYINRKNENIDPALIGNSPIENHHSYTLRNIYIQTDFNPKDPTHSIPQDTIYYHGYYLLSQDSERIIRNDQLLGTIFFQSGDLYLQPSVDYSYTRLQDLNIFKFINIQFSEVPREFETDSFKLDVTIQLTPMDQQDVTFEAEATNTGGNLGLAGSVGYRNKNLFRNAEVLEIKVKGAVEALPNFNQPTENKKIFAFNTFELGPQVNLTFKKFLLPKFITKGTSRFFNPRTNLNIGYNYQNRPDFTRSILNISLGYLWKGSKTQRFAVYPFEVNSVYVNPSPAFQAKLDSLNDPRLLYSYDTHLIPSGRFTWVFNNQEIRKNGNFFFVRGNLEFAGLILTGLAKPLNLKTDAEGNYKVFDIKYSQYIKPDIDMSYHQLLDPNNSLVYRIAAGIGIPVFTSRALPFEKSFFAGGANSLRAWSARTLGPGAYKKLVNIEQSGDIKIEANFEYRSFLLHLLESAQLEGAAFVDAGNIWTRNDDPARPGSQFEFQHMIKEMGLGAGVGLRFNFSFFILRLDAAVKLRDPSLDLAKRWVYPNQKFVIGDITPNLAIGYPF
ncbi:MAG: BamA/TamA family outer membrane protein [Bacteroidetes bacterium]|nr:BamA/TamA family outer membrane protein [Bacteroidota bacterium]MBP6648103.1 BamA/TamA family outer membrane protein [Bacteroidia bacterium]